MNRLITFKSNQIGMADSNLNRISKLRRSRLLSVQIVLITRLYPGPGIYPGPGFYQNRFEFINFCNRYVSIWQLLHKLNIAWNNCFRKKFNVCHNYTLMTSG